MYHRSISAGGIISISIMAVKAENNQRNSERASKRSAWRRNRNQYGSMA